MTNPQERIQELTQVLQDYNYHYYVLDTSLVSDFEFDTLLKELQELEEKHPEFSSANSPTKRVGGDVTQSLSRLCINTPCFLYLTVTQKRILLILKQESKN